MLWSQAAAEAEGADADRGAVAGGGGGSGPGAEAEVKRAASAPDPAIGHVPDATVLAAAATPRSSADGSNGAGASVPQQPPAAVPGPSSPKSASRSLWRALLMPQVNSGSLYHCGKRS